MPTDKDYISAQDNTKSSVEKSFDFLEKKTEVTNAVRKSVGLKAKKPRPEQDGNSTMLNSKNGRYLIAGMVAVAGMVGIHMGIEDAGWLIFLAFVML